MAAEISTVADDEVVVHDGTTVRRYEGLAPGTEHTLDGETVRTLPRPAGALLCRVATVNDTHFGETLCGLVEGTDIGPVLRVDPADPYPEMMNAAAAGEIAAIDPAVVLAKGDLTTDGTAAEWARFEAVYGATFGERLHLVRGNHDAMAGLDHGTGAPFTVDVPGARLAVLDTVVAFSDRGRLSTEQVEWLDDTARDAGADGVPLLVFGHHHAWNPEATIRPDDYFGINPDDTDRLVDVVARRPAIRGYFAGHTHRNRVRRFAATGEVPFVEVACVKDYPGTWAEYRIHEGGILQVHRRISSPAALAWSERCRAMYDGGYADYALGSLDDRCFALPSSR
ncbi:MAG: metallophosphoesterase [Actinomycetota bacterium]|nr:metallophosphoesterase [Acidimicrobiia bacterium]MDQ3294497.1 metallophosphoesterase [Actinomycetota bacterium]